MDQIKTKAIRELEQRLNDSDAASLRHMVLENAKNFKTSWIGLGQSLYTVWKDKLYKEWGYSTFEVYTAKEIGIRKQTALKLLKSYYFLEKEEPRYLKQDYYNQQADALSVPSYEAVDVLRLASNNREIDKADYQQIKKNVLEEGKDVHSVKKDLTTMIKQREELLPQEAWQKKKLTLLRRFISLLKSIREEIKQTKVLSAQVVKEIDKLIAVLETELPSS